jgi:hypothetical protein
VIKHLVCFNFKPDAGDEKVQGTLAALDALPGQIPWVRHWSLGRNVSDRDQTYAYALSCDFADLDELNRYLTHPAHVEVARQWLGPYWANRAIIDYEFNG